MIFVVLDGRLIVGYNFTLIFSSTRSRNWKWYSDVGLFSDFRIVWHWLEIEAHRTTKKCDTPNSKIGISRYCGRGQQSTL